MIHLANLVMPGVLSAPALPISSPLVLGEGLVLVSWWKAALLLVPFVPWALVCSKVLDKHSKRFNLPREQWNTMLLMAGLIAVIAAISIPMKGEGAFWIGWALMIVILVASVLVFALVTNKDERVPEAFRLSLDMSKMGGDKDAKAKAKLQGKVELVLKGPDKSVLAPPQTDNPDFAVRVRTEELFIQAVSARASQIDIASVGKPEVYAVTTLVDGLRQTLEIAPADAKAGTPAVMTLSAAEANKVIGLWQAAAKLDVNERRKRQQADVTVERGTSKYKVRVTTIGGQQGLRATLLLDPEKAVQRKQIDMGWLEPQINEVKALSEVPGGLVLLSSPPDGGRTTTFYQFIKLHDAYTKNLQTIEVEQQDAIEGVRQNKFDPQAEGAEFSTVVRSLLRRDPDVLGVAELPDTNTAKEITRADFDRTRVYVSVKADSSLAALQGWVKMVGETESAVKPIRAVVNQRLARKLCVNCRVPYQPSPDMLKKLGLPADKIKQLFKKGGQVLIKNKPEICPVCSGVGYIGQEGIFEFVPIGDAERAALRNNDMNAMKVEMRKRNLPTLQQAALKKALDGVTSVEEIMRVTAEAQAAPAPAAQAPAKPAAPAKQ